MKSKETEDIIRHMLKNQDAHILAYGIRHVLQVQYDVKLTYERVRQIIEKIIKEQKN